MKPYTKKLHLKNYLYSGYKIGPNVGNVYVFVVSIKNVLNQLNMLLFYALKKNKRSKEFQIKTKFAPISEEDRERLLFEVFDTIFSQKKPEKNKENKIKSKPEVMHYLTLTPFPQSSKIEVDT